MSGKETLIALKEHVRWKDVPVILFTTSIRTVGADVLAVYKVEVVQKPANYKDITETVKYMLGHCAEV